MSKPHYEFVNAQNIKAAFSSDKKHRLSLTIPFSGREDRETLCVIGQNPSEANELCADKTVYYLEEYIWKRHEKYGALAIVNLYSRVDTKKKVESGKLLTKEAEMEFWQMVDSCTDVLALFGALRNDEPYCFMSRVAEIQGRLHDKRVYKLAIGSEYAPHPGNPKIFYNNFDVALDEYTFRDVRE